MILYHYTTEEAWKKIQSEGLKPALINNHPDLFAHYPEGVQGVWLWENNPQGVHHTGALMLTVHLQRKTRIVKLKVEVEERDLVTPEPPRRLVIFNTGAIGDFQFCENEPTRICGSVIKPRNIKLMKMYDMVELLK